jgi:hypothetical protein
LNEEVAAPVKKIELTAVGICCADHAIPSIRKKLALTLPTNGGLSVGIVRLRTKGHGERERVTTPEDGRVKPKHLVEECT